MATPCGVTLSWIDAAGVAHTCRIPPLNAATPAAIAARLRRRASVALDLGEDVGATVMSTAAIVYEAMARRRAAP
jgi:hypothetical protein